ncbi:MAG TPA: PQQ-binding-like beta-propeller repeat protein [bacterium]|nr:PQQ-binding-like beta-propeller repeat protein [bacterium]
MIRKLAVSLGIVMMISCDTSHHGRDRCEEGMLSASDAVWTHSEGDLQNTKRATGMRIKGCQAGPITKPVVQWAFELGGAGTAAAPVIGDDGTIYITGEYPGEPLGGGWRNAGLMAINPNGTLKWFFHDSLDIGTAIAAIYQKSVAIDQHGILYYAGLNKVIYAITPEDGKVLWSRKSDAPNMGLVNPVIDERRNIYTANDTVFCFKYDGTLRWTFAEDTSLGQCEEIALGEDMIFCSFFRKGVLALDYKGNKKWFHPAEMTSFRAGIIVDESDNIYFKVNSGNIRSVDRYGQVRWYGSAGGGFTALALRGEYLYFGSLSSLYKLDKATGTQITYIGGAMGHYYLESSSPLVDDAGNVFIATSTDYVLGAQNDGQELWHTTLDDLSNLAECYGPLALGHDGTIYVPVFNDISGKVQHLYAIK